MKKIALITVSASLLAISACASVKDGQMQDVTIKTPGAENAKCYLENEDFKYVAFTDETVKIMKSPHDMTVRCQAPGNRERTVEVPRMINEEVKKNVVNGFIPGAAYDYFSRAAFMYPSEIIVSFAGEQVKSYGLPDHQARDLGNQTHEFERYGPAEIISEENRYEQTNPLRKKFRNYSSDRSATDMPRVTGSYYDPREEDKLERFMMSIINGCFFSKKEIDKDKEFLKSQGLSKDQITAILSYLQNRISGAINYVILVSILLGLLGAWLGATLT